MEKQQEHISYAYIGLSIMCLTTTLFHIYTTSKLWNPDKPRTQLEDTRFQLLTILLFLALIPIWILGFYFWIENLAHISIIYRNQSLLLGIGAANIGLLWMTWWTSSATFHNCVIYALWPAYIGLILGCRLIL